MFYHSPMYIIKKRWKTIIFGAVAVSLLSVMASLLFPLEYRADAQALIISKSRYGVDPYTVVKSAERVGENIIQIMKTDDFFEKVMERPGYSIDDSRFRVLSERNKRKLWRETIKSSVVYGTGILNISAYHADPEQAKSLAAAAADTLAAKGWEYIGGDVTIKIVNSPVATRFPARPNFALNALAGFIAGLLVMALFVLRDRVNFKLN